MARILTNACMRCKKQFPSAEEHVEHLHGSTHHHLCAACNFEKDFPTFEESREHIHASHLVCMSCGWPAASDEALVTHTLSIHNMCPDCKMNIETHHEFNGHCQLKRPRSVECIGCDLRFGSLSGVFNHLQSSNCPSGITGADIEGFAHEYLSKRDVVGFSCPSCQKQYARMCDFMQHAETPSCKDGYWKTSGSVGQLVEHILARIRMVIPPKEVILHDEDP